MDECKIYSEGEEGEIISDFEEDFTEELSNYPRISQFIQKLRDHIKRQRKKINKLRNKLAEQVYIFGKIIVFIFGNVNFILVAYVSEECINIYILS